MRHNDAAWSDTWLILHCSKVEGNSSERHVELLGQDTYLELPNNYFWPAPEWFTSSPVTDNIKALWAREIELFPS